MCAMMQKLRVSSIPMKAALCGAARHGSIVGQALRLPNFRIGNRCGCPTTNIDIMPKLILTTQAQGKVAYEFAERLITIGRAPDNMIVIDDPSVSNRHAQLELTGEIYRLKDLDSTNGTKVNGVPITETALRSRTGFVSAQSKRDSSPMSAARNRCRSWKQSRRDRPSRARPRPVSETLRHSGKDRHPAIGCALSF